MPPTYDIGDFPDAILLHPSKKHPEIFIVTLTIEVPEPRATIIFSHGNAETIHDITDQMRYLAHYLQCRIVLYDYEGYGASSGKATTVSVTRDIHAVYAYVLAELEPDPRRIVAWGRSIGSGPTGELARRTPALGGVILESGVASAMRVVFDLRVPMLGDKFANYRYVRRVGAPVLLVHGTADEVVPFRNAELVARNLQCDVEPLFLDGGGHNDLLWRFHQQLLSRIWEFIQADVLHVPDARAPALGAFEVAMRPPRACRD
eukprot:gnl/Chilomastix_cuspidata/1322.p1 GENE.gnl/Chilomastix_cuspidata/1322~~gnl/Chilomastix_cuspidata/1322.p1  ORF type:complete len:286 (+),score=107.02 gnl/Chilomastix_cuspidata/1322:77-859(+)